ncbi:MAG: hypothetical protein O2955_21660 [Planctomycetota bacterium]|nr:hypothetical protein [Planctomycetota bacterium]MDA1215114.1 hypothetical protein [Planctomycetota bacterium]
MNHTPILSNHRFHVVSCHTLAKKIWCDEYGFIISAELILVATLLVIGVIVGLSELQAAVVQELNDVGDAIGSLNQTYYYGGMAARNQNVQSNCYIKSFTFGSGFTDFFDNNQCDLTCNMPMTEVSKW